jgi:inner membrane protease ATP23
MAAAADDDDAKSRDLPAMLPVTPSQTATFSDLYPERRGKSVDFSTWQIFTGRAKVDSLRRVCEENVVSCLEEMPMVRTMVGALAAQGCPVDLERHILCDICLPVGHELQLGGGYDDQENQVFVCANNAENRGLVHGVLVRNLMHLFDRCVSKVDFKNVDHLACMEVRKANLANCGFLVYMTRHDARVGVKCEHANCVRNVATESLVKTKFVDEATAKEAVDRVFGKCYSDLEPYGRRARNEADIKMAHAERYLYGYS